MAALAAASAAAASAAGHHPGFHPAAAAAFFPSAATSNIPGLGFSPSQVGTFRCFSNLEQRGSVLARLLTLTYYILT